MPKVRPPAAPRTSRAVFSLWLDAGLLALWLLIQSPRATGVFLHEVLGLALAAPLILHLLLSWHWILVQGRGLLTTASWRTRFNYAVNVALFAVMAGAIISGLVVSESVLPAVGLQVIQDMQWLRAHDLSSNLLFVAVALHLAMNWGWVKAVALGRALTAREAEVNMNEDREESA
jgi:hypothetical protein